MNNLKVFICDDSATVRERLVTLALELPEVDVVGQAEDAPGSLDAIRQTQPDVVILDIRMPGGSGIEVLREVNKMTPAPKVIMLTNFAYVQYQKKCAEAGADFFFDKSTEFDQIPHALEQVRQDLRAELVQKSDPPIPDEGGLTSGSGQEAGAACCPERPRKLEGQPIRRAGGSPDDQGRLRRQMGGAVTRTRSESWWGKLTDDDLEQAGGKADQLIALLQQKYGYTRKQAEKEAKRRLKQAKDRWNRITNSRLLRATRLAPMLSILEE